MGAQRGANRSGWPLQRHFLRTGTETGLPRCQRHVASVITARRPTDMGRQFRPSVTFHAAPEPVDVRASACTTVGTPRHAEPVLGAPITARAGPVPGMSPQAARQLWAFFKQGQTSVRTVRSVINLDKLFTLGRSPATGP